MMKLYRQIHPVGNRFTFSITLPGFPKFRPEESFETAADAAFYCDVFKLLLVTRYKLTGNTMWNSLTPDAFKTAAYDIGLNLKDPKEVFEALPTSCQNFLLDGGHETLTEFMTNQALIRAGHGFKGLQ